MTDHGTIETLDGGSHVLRYERRLRHPVDKVWEALTDPAQIDFLEDALDGRPVDCRTGRRTAGSSTTSSTRPACGPSAERCRASTAAR